jgi:hypothetical protein
MILEADAFHTAEGNIGDAKAPGTWGNRPEGPR